MAHYNFEQCSSLRAYVYCLQRVDPIKFQERRTRRRTSAASIWFEIWGESWIRVKKLRFFPANFGKISIFFRQFYKRNFDFQARISELPFSLQNFHSARQNWPFTATSGQIILFLFKTRHFPTYFLYMIL